MNNLNLAHYRQSGFNDIGGWCHPALFEIVDYLNDMEFNKIGGCAEIGIFQGKFFMLLNSIINSDYESYAIDIFGDQFLSLDNYGTDIQDIFYRNLLKYDAHNGSNVKIVKADSTDSLLIEKYNIPLNAFRFVSVDAGHSIEHTVSDLHVANRLVANEGVVILDDFLHYHWPGVTEGVGRFLNMAPTLVPFAMGFNKLFFCKVSWQHHYFQHFANMYLKSKIVTVYGHQVVVLGAY